MLAYLQERHEEWLGLYEARRAAGDGSGRAGVAAVFDAYADHANAAYVHGFRGCGLLNAAAELPSGAPGREQVRRHKEEVQQLRRHRVALRAQGPAVALSAAAVAVFPLAFYSSMRLSGVAVGTVVTIGSAPPAAALVAALVDRAVDGTPLSRRWAVGTALGLLGVTALAFSHAGPAGGGPVGAGAAAVDGWGHVASIGLGLLGGATYALDSWGAVRVIRTGIPTRAAMGAVFGLGGVLLMPVLVLTGSGILATRVNLAVVTHLAVVPMFLGYVLLGRGLASVGASTATTLSLAEPGAVVVIAVLALLLAGLVTMTAPGRGAVAD